MRSKKVKGLKQFTISEVYSKHAVIRDTYNLPCAFSDDLSFSISKIIGIISYLKVLLFHIEKKCNDGRRKLLRVHSKVSPSFF